jgi:hypothetical protein
MDAAPVLIEFIISYIGSINFSSSSKPTYFFIGRLRISPRVKSGKVCRLK